MKVEPRLGFSIPDGNEVTVPLWHTAVAGMTQSSGKTTTLEAMATRSKKRVIAFVTKRGEGSFATGRRIQPYFRDRADWQFVSSIIDATLQEKNKFLRPWIMKICRTTKTLAEVQEKVREALKSAKGINEGVYTQLDEYLSLIVPEIGRARLASTLEIGEGLNVMDVSDFATPMQMLFVQSAIDWVNAEEQGVIVVVPEAWEFIPEGKGSPVKHSAITLVRKGAAIGNFIWVDSQDIAGVDKTILRGCALWIIGVQREANEIARTLANIPAGTTRPRADEIATLERGQFYACHGRCATLTYVQPAWMNDETAIAVARGKLKATDLIPNKPPQPPKGDPMSDPRAYVGTMQAENEHLKKQLKEAMAEVERLRGLFAAQPKTAFPPENLVRDDCGVDFDALYGRIKERLRAEAPGLMTLLLEKPELVVKVARKELEIDGGTGKGRIAKLIASDFFKAPGKTQSAVRTELKRTGSDMNSGNISTIIAGFVVDGFLSREAGDLYMQVPGMVIKKA